MPNVNYTLKPRLNEKFTQDIFTNLVQFGQHNSESEVREICNFHKDAAKQWKLRK